MPSRRVRLRIKSECEADGVWLQPGDYYGEERERPFVNAPDGRQPPEYWLQIPGEEFPIRVTDAVANGEIQAPLTRLSRS